MSAFMIHITLHNEYLLITPWMVDTNAAYSLYTMVAKLLRLSHSRHGTHKDYGWIDVKDLPDSNL